MIVKQGTPLEKVIELKERGQHILNTLPDRGESTQVIKEVVLACEKYGEELKENL